MEENAQTKVGQRARRAVAKALLTLPPPFGARVAGYSSSGGAAWVSYMEAQEAGDANTASRHSGDARDMRANGMRTALTVALFIPPCASRSPPLCCMTTPRRA